MVFSTKTNTRQPTMQVVPYVSNRLHDSTASVSPPYPLPPQQMNRQLQTSASPSTEKISGIAFLQTNMIGRVHRSNNSCSSCGR